jgi:hypothetical protein
MERRDKSQLGARRGLSTGHASTAAALIACLIGAGCGSSGREALPISGDSAVVTLIRTCSPESCNHYLNVLPELPEDGNLDRSQAIELGDAQGSVFNNAVYIFEYESQTVQRFALDEQGALQAGPRISFQGLGIVGVSGILNAWASPERAFLLDPISAQIVTWNPTEMLVVTATPIPGAFLSRDGLNAEFSWPNVVNGRVLFNVNWFNWDTNQGHPSLALLSFDANGDTPEPVLLEDERCAGASTVAPFGGADERLYAIGDGMGGVMTLSTAGDSGPCALRAVQGAAQFDPDYRLDLSAGVGVQAFGAGWPLPGGDALVAKVWTPAQAPQLPLTNLDEFFESTEFSWALVDLATGATRRIEDIPAGGWGNLTPLELDGVRYVQNYPPKDADDAYPEATLYAVQADGSATAVLRGGSSGDFEMLGRLQSVPRPPTE